MSLFLVTAILSFGVFLVIARIRPRTDVWAERFRDGDPWRDLWTTRMLAAWIGSVLAVAVLLLLILGVFWRSFAVPNAPEEPFFELVGSRHFAHVFFGFLFGVAAGYWALSLFYRDPTKPAGYIEIVAGVAVLVFLLLGVAGEDALVRMLERLTSVEIGGAKLSFSDASGVKVFANNAGVTAAGVSRAAPPAQSSGLLTIQSLPDAIDRDRKYAILLAAAGGLPSNVTDALEKEFDEAKKNADGALAVPAKCLADYADLTGDDLRIGRVLEPFAERMRDYAATPPNAAPGPIDSWSKSFQSRFQAIWEEFNFIGSCGKNGDPKQTEISAILGPLKTDAWRRRPYFAIIFSSMLAFDHQYVVALNSLYEAIDTTAEAPDKASGGADEELNKQLRSVKKPVFELRVRALIAQYLDEWTSAYGVKTPSVVAFQEENFTRMIDLLTERDLSKLIGPVLAQMKVKPSGLLEHAFLTDPSFDSCSRPNDALLNSDDRWSNALFLTRTLISMKLNWVFSALESSDYYDSSATQAEQYVDDLVGLNLQCLDFQNVATKSSIRLRTEQILEAYARVKLANLTGTQKLQQTRGAETIKSGLELALAAVVLAESIAKADADRGNCKEGAAENPYLLCKISGSDASDERTYLLRVKIQIEQALASN